MKIIIDHTKDGIEHINCYTKGRTEVGILLGNLSYSPFVHKKDGPFDSIEAYWYWLQTGDNALRFMHGVEAKKAGQESIKANGKKEIADFKEKIKEALNLKINENPKIMEMLKETTLPLTHYYVRTAQNKTFAIPLEKHMWVFKELEKIRDRLNGVYVPEEVEDIDDKDYENTISMF